VSTPTITPPGWYPDPERVGSMRYWDGHIWTEQRAPGASQPLPPPPGMTQPVPSAHKKPFYRRWWFIGGAVIVLIAVIANIANGGSSPSSTSTATASAGASAKAAPAPAAAAHFGSAVRDGKFEFVVTSMKCGAPSVGSSGLTSKAQGQFCLVTVSVKNIGTEPQTMFDSNQTVVDAKGAKYQPDTTAGLYANPSDSFFVKAINPGNSMTGVIVYDVPKGLTPTAITLHDSMFSGGVEVLLK